MSYWENSSVNDRQPRAAPTPVASRAVSAPTPVTVAQTPINDSPRPDSPASPPPEGLQGDVELELAALANALYNLGTTAINDNSREKPGPDGNRPEKKIGARV